MEYYIYLFLHFNFYTKSALNNSIILFFVNNNVFLKANEAYFINMGIYKYNVLIYTFLSRHLLLSVKYIINSKNNHMHIWQCDVTGT